MDQVRFYERLKKELEETTSFPSKYLFKFIVPNVEERVKDVELLFDHTGAVIQTKPSKNGNYIAVSIEVEMVTADLIIEKYQQAALIPGIVSL